MKKIIEQTIKKVLQDLKLKAVKFSVEHPENMAWGDYSTNAGIITHQPQAICDRLKAEKTLSKIASKIEVAGAGFINISIQPEALITQTDKLLKDGVTRLRQGFGGQRKIMVEFAHPNTHKEMHIGHMRTLIVGEALARILTAAGARVFRANYQGDIGPHVAKSIWGTQKILAAEKSSWDQAEKLSLTEKAHLLGRGYVRGNQDYEANKAEIDQLNTKIYAHDKQTEPIYQQTRKWSLDYYGSFYQRFGTKFDRLFFESEVAEKGKEIVLKNLDKVFKKSAGAVVFPGENYGLHTRVFVTQDGNPTYEAKDMGLAPAQFKAFPFDRCVHVVANEQTGYFQVIIKALELLDQKFIGREYHLSMGMVNLIGKKISSRTGEIITVDGLLEEVKENLKSLAKNQEALEAVTIGAVKYSVLKTGCRQDVAFDIKKSVSLDGNSGPYLQYTYARAKSVLAKAKIQQGPALPGGKNGPLNQEESTLLRTLYRFEEVVVQAAEQLAPNLIANFIYDVAQKFNSFYNQHRVIGNDFRLWLTGATAEILNRGLNLLGIDAPEKM
ncbi:MAG: Arginine-tRNA ligase [Candidatus Beckwithbacteria bacterium GW2011_GWC2_47_9]|uniref:Arginine--tRNA ligase n=1 Tax=Candidatus Beckwithbacteria bacterium GW2011_GWC2_47_9 TaxID=1618373 RepID=A0A0G1WX10_9BACT|nr:MAG: Arginine-tRNA ligase [Candidatus Beckwithbacteria bacterium GW2011_GWC2_47_9]